MDKISPIAPPCVPKGHYNRHQACVAAMAGNFKGVMAQLVQAAVDEGWSRREALDAVRELRTREAV